jgi:hypothetical protein
VQFDPNRAISLSVLARAYALQNNRTETRNEYEKFFALWKEADADVPVLKQARRECAHLQ